MEERTGTTLLISEAGDVVVPCLHCAIVCPSALPIGPWAYEALEWGLLFSLLPWCNCIILALRPLYTCLLIEQIRNCSSTRLQSSHARVPGCVVGKPHSEPHPRSPDSKCRCLPNLMFWVLLGCTPPIYLNTITNDCRQVQHRKETYSSCCQINL